MQLTIASELAEELYADVRLVHVDEPPHEVSYGVWRHVPLTPDAPVRLALPDALRLQARTALTGAQPTPPFEPVAGRAYRVTGDENGLELQLDAKWQNVFARPRISVINDSRCGAKLEFLAGDTVVWGGSLNVVDYGIFELSFAIELTFTDSAGRAISRSIYVPPDDTAEAVLLVRRVLSTGRVYVEATPSSPCPAVSRWSSPSRITFQQTVERPDFVRRLAVFLIPRDANGIALFPWKTFDLRAAHRFQFDPEAHAVTLCNHRRALLPGQVVAAVEAADGDVELIADTDAWLDPHAARIDNYAPRALEVQLLSGPTPYGVMRIPAMSDGMPPQVVVTMHPPHVAELLHPFSIAELTAAADVVPMPMPGSDVHVHVERWRVRVDEQISRKEK